MKLVKYTFSLVIILSLITCGKYEEGPGFSLLPNQRLQQKWRPIEKFNASSNRLSLLIEMDLILNL